MQRGFMHTMRRDPSIEPRFNYHRFTSHADSWQETKASDKVYAIDRKTAVLVICTKKHVTETLNYGGIQRTQVRRFILGIQERIINLALRRRAQSMPMYS